MTENACNNSYSSTEKRDATVNHTRHAKEQYKMRGIEEKHVEHCIKYGKREIQKGNARGEMITYRISYAGLNVIACEDSGWTVTTAYWSRKDEDWGEERKHFEFFAGM